MLCSALTLIILVTAQEFYEAKAPSKGCYLHFYHSSAFRKAAKYATDEGYMSQRVCATRCLMDSRRWKFFGLHGDRWCYCGDAIYSGSITNSLCDSRCINNVIERCGGKFGMEIFDLVPVPKNNSGETA
uniref:WSC domain-containing protein n=1 Tax=Macrostomum lignano TaxID=282301 RepID=A0A1I8G3A9_9PLAT